MMDVVSEFWTVLWGFLQRNSSGFGIVLSIVGFGITWWQLVRTRTAAIAAQHASREAIAAVGRADTIADLAAIQAGYHEVQTALRGGRYENAVVRCQALREGLARVRTRSGFETEKRQLRVQKMVTDLRKLQDVMERRLADPSTEFAAATANRVLSDAAAEFGAWIEELRYVAGGQ